MTLLAACGPGLAEPVPEEDLAFPSDTLEAGWGNLPTAAALSGGRWAVVSSDWAAAVIADFNRKEIAPLGGPAQKAYTQPWSCSPSVTRSISRTGENGGPRSGPEMAGLIDSFRRRTPCAAVRPGPATARDSCTSR
jgi:hypothetical protein